MNRLQDATSAYLKSAAHQPIDWYEFGDEAFARARELDRPILLDIGAVWCHWCHVIDRESYDDPAIAELINQHFVAVKVDRDQRPDVDARYQQVVQSMTGQGGWPLTGFLTYDGRLIYGGTYFPPQVMKNLLLKISTLYHEKKLEILAESDLLSDEMARRQQAERTAWALQENTAPPDRTLIQNVVFSAQRMFDPENGGFGTQPKFPHFSALQLLIAEAFHANTGLNPKPGQSTVDGFAAAGVSDFANDDLAKQDPSTNTVLEMICRTLTRMGQGGIYDQIAGGFHRYSVDRLWHVPHFEKMAYDNAEALRVYCQAYRLTGNAFYREIAEGIIAWVNRDLSDQALGGFFASQDADIDLEDDGDHFTWTLQEIRETLTPDEADLVILYYGMTDAGDMHERPGRNVLMQNRNLMPDQQGSQQNTQDPAAPWQELSLRFKRSEDEVKALLASAKSKLLAKRLTRPVPFIDRTLYANWNAMFLVSYFEAADLLERDDVRAFAVKTLDRLLDEFYLPDQGVYHSFGIQGFLDDQAWFILALLSGYQSTGNARYLYTAIELADLVRAQFEDTVLGGFFDTCEQTDAIGLLKFRRKPVEDSPSSSANAVMIQALLQLYALTDNPVYQQSAGRALTFFKSMEGYGVFVGALAVGLDWYTRPPVKIELAGPSEEALFPWAAEARRLFAPGKLLSYAIQPDMAQPDRIAPEARICFGQRCLPPLKRLEDLTQAIQLPKQATVYSR